MDHGKAWGILTYKGKNQSLCIHETIIKCCLLIMWSRRIPLISFKKKCMKINLRQCIMQEQLFLLICLDWQEKQKVRSKKLTRLCTMTGAWFPNTWSSSLGILSRFLSRPCATSFTLHCSEPWFWPSIRKHMELQWQKNHCCLYRGMSCSTKTISKNRNESGKEQRGLQCDTPGSKHDKSFEQVCFDLSGSTCIFVLLSPGLYSWSQTILHISAYVVSFVLCKCVKGE